MAIQAENMRKNAAEARKKIADLPEKMNFSRKKIADLPEKMNFSRKKIADLPEKMKISRKKIADLPEKMKISRKKIAVLPEKMKISRKKIADLPETGWRSGSGTSPLSRYIYWESMDCSRPTGWQRSKLMERWPSEPIGMHP